jgi:hypothetical protein
MSANVCLQSMSITYIHRDDVGHGKERRKTSSEFSGEPRIGNLVGLWSLACVAKNKTWTYMTRSIEMEVFSNNRACHSVIEGRLISFDEAHVCRLTAKMKRRTRLRKD